MSTTTARRLVPGKGFETVTASGTCRHCKKPIYSAGGPEQKGRLGYLHIETGDRKCAQPFTTAEPELSDKAKDRIEAAALLVKDDDDEDDDSQKTYHFSITLEQTGVSADDAWDTLLAYIADAPTEAIDQYDSVRCIDDDPYDKGDAADARQIDAVEALRGLFEHCTMVHKHWGEGSNQKEADAAKDAARALLAPVDSESEATNA